MQKSIHIESSSSGNLSRVLSITDPIEGLVIDGREYILIDTYIEEPALPNDMAVNYPFYNKETGEFKWVQVAYQTTSDEYNKNIEELRGTIDSQAAQISSLQATIDELKASTEESQAVTYEALATIIESNEATNEAPVEEGAVQ